MNDEEKGWLVHKERVSYPKPAPLRCVGGAPGWVTPSGSSGSRGPVMWAGEAALLRSWGLEAEEDLQGSPKPEQGLSAEGSRAPGAGVQEKEASRETGRFWA